jgi:hypothetical protein
MGTEVAQVSAGTCLLVLYSAGSLSTWPSYRLRIVQSVLCTLQRRCADMSISAMLGEPVAWADIVISIHYTLLGLPG